MLNALLAQTETPPNLTEEAGNLWNTIVDFLSNKGLEFGINLLAALVMTNFGEVGIGFGIDYRNRAHIGPDRFAFDLDEAGTA